MGIRSVSMAVSCLILAVAVALVATNPSPDDYVNHLKGIAIANKAPAEAFPVMGTWIKERTHRDNYYLFSVYTTASGKELLRFVGVLGRFSRRN